MDNVNSEGNHCMNFTNEEIMSYLVKPLKKHPNICVKALTLDEKEVQDTNEQIRYVSIDEDKDCYFSFLGFQTSLFVLEEEFMFIDDEAKENIVSSHTYGNVVYEGNLRDKSHKEILELMYQISSILVNVNELEIEERKVSQTGIQYPKCEYNVKLVSDVVDKGSIRFSNILFTFKDNLD
ncbi:hypothetical protein RQP50_24050 [Paenibacillus sp. chi10]|uniref:Uncharacterized protein n=2 Tax=Paenibacillus TaxID=44249 RepID=A0AAJ2JZG0_9BACL|nr:MULTISPECIES: hypothetical protein [unclassified Paenibacillus]MDT8979316.1 hypothetical protein [Paenibacillus sp. chi10]GAV13702.1 hypothetical protein PBN151_3639 [Paenibacillus sp. NAIST15-1]